VISQLVGLVQHHLDPGLARVEEAAEALDPPHVTRAGAPRASEAEEEADPALSCALELLLTLLLPRRGAWKALPLLADVSGLPSARGHRVDWGRGALGSSAGPAGGGARGRVGAARPASTAGGCRGLPVQSEGHSLA